VVDDAAQGFGGTFADRPCGGHGDFGITSFSKGKGLSTFEGGALLSSDLEFIDRAGRLLREENQRPYSAVSMAFRSAGFAVFQRPRLYALVHWLPMLELGRSVFDPGFGVGVLTGFQAALGLEALAGSSAVVDARRCRAERYRQLLGRMAGLTLPRPQPEAEPAWTRFPLLIGDQARRSAILTRLTRAGLGASASYPEALSSLQELRPYLADCSPGGCPGATRLARTIVTLPTHPSVRPEDQERIRDIISRALDGFVPGNEGA
jgi:dTDP-4-amino-4,6-dideoxygalactose transaminase